MSNLKTLIIYQSIHHGNTLKVAKVMAEEVGIKIKKSSEINPGEITELELVGFGSGIYDDKHHNNLLDLARALPNNSGRKAFIFSTSGVPVKILGDNFLQNYMLKAHRELRDILISKGYEIVGELILPGFNTNVFLKYFGGLNKNRPNEDDFEKAREFIKNLKYYAKNNYC